MHPRSIGAVLTGLVLGFGAPALAQDAPKADAPAPAAAAPAADTPAPAPASTDNAPGVIKIPNLGTLTIGGSMRIRAEYLGPTTYDTVPVAPVDPDLDTSFMLLRTRLWLGLEINDHVSGRIEFQDSRVWGTEGGVTGNLAGFDLYQGYLTLSGLFEMPLDLTMGRFAIPKFGDQRIMSDLDWHNYGRVFDGFHATYDADPLTFHLLAVNIAEAAVGVVPNNSADDDHWFTGLVTEYRPKESNLKADVYLFGRFSEVRTTVGEIGPPDWWRQATIGAWVKYAMAPLTFTTELYGQFGRRGRDDILAWAFALNTVWKACECFSVLAEYNYASGDHRPTDGKANTFDPLFPFAHAFNGHIDAVQWSNVHVVKLGFKIGLGGFVERLKGWSAHMDLLGFWLASRRDAWYGVTGGAWRRDPTRTVAGSGAIGSEVDLYVKGKLYGAVDVWVGYSHFFPGVYAHDTVTPTGGGTDHDQNWVFLQLGTKF